MLKTRNIFLDTQYFVKNRFNFEHVELQTLEELVRNGHVHVYLTDITEREIRKKIADEIGNAVNVLNSREIKYLSILPEFKKIQEKYNSRTVVAMYDTKFKEFQKRCKIEIISSASVNLMKIFDDYCNMLPPFNAKQNKKAEFPDAFALAAIANWGQKERKKAYLLTQDNDWKLFADNSYIGLDGELRFECLARMVDFTSRIYHTEKSLSNLVTFSDALIIKHGEQITDYAHRKIEEAVFEGDSEYEMDIAIFEEHILDTKIVSADILSCDRHGAIYAVVFLCTGIFGFSMPDYDNATWDPEDSIYRGLANIDIFQKQEFTVLSEVMLGFKEGLAANFEIESIGIEDEIIIDYDDDDAETITVQSWNEQIPVHLCGVLDGQITSTGEGEMTFPNINEAKKIFPSLDIYKASADFTKALNGNFEKELRFETWKLYNELSD